MKKPYLLIVDDEPALQDLMKTMLEASGMLTASAYSTREGFEILEQDPLPDVMILDLRLPQTDGMHLLRQVRALARYEAMPIIILSALVEVEQIKEGLDAGADQYITKPYLSRNLLRVVKELLEQGRPRTRRAHE